MKKNFILFLMLLSFSFFSCEEKESEFEIWASSLTWDEAQEILESSRSSFMRDARTIPSLGASFSYQDEITEQGDISADVSYPYTLSEGKTTVFHAGTKIFEEAWGVPTYAGANMMTQVMYGELSGISCLRITNQTEGDGGQSSYLEHRLFLDENGSLREVDLKGMGVTYDLWIGSAAMEDVLIIHTADFIRTDNRQEHIILLEISTGRYFRMDREV